LAEDLVIIRKAAARFSRDEILRAVDAQSTSPSRSNRYDDLSWLGDGSDSDEEGESDESGEDLEARSSEGDEGEEEET